MIPNSTHLFSHWPIPVPLRGMYGTRPIEILSMTDGKSPQIKHNTTHEQVKGIKMKSRR
jgi:hypothetical protein